MYAAGVSPVWASDRYDALRRQSLTALPPVRVLAECAPDLEKAGLVCEPLRKAVEKQLAQGEVPVYLDLAAHPQVKTAYLTVALSSAKIAASHTFQTYGVTIRVDLVQDAILPRFQERIFPATTWNTTRTVVLGPRRLKDLATDVRELVEQFITDHQAAQK